MSRRYAAREAREDRLEGRTPRAVRRVPIGRGGGAEGIDGEEKATGGGVWMARKMTELPSKRGPIAKIMPSDGCKGDTVPLAVGGGTIFTNLDGIWGMSG